MKLDPQVHAFACAQEKRIKEMKQEEAEKEEQKAMAQMRMAAERSRERLGVAAMPLMLALNMPEWVFGDDEEGLYKLKFAAQEFISTSKRILADIEEDLIKLTQLIEEKKPNGKSRKQTPRAPRPSPSAH